MAQAVFDEHPLEQYLREAGEGQEIMPGLTIALIQELEPFPASLLTDTDNSATDPDNAANESDEEWRPQFLIYLFHYIETLIATAQLTKSSNPLVERFKYNVISSSLLSSDLTAPHSHAHPRNSSGLYHQIPGNLPHSRTASETSQAQHHDAVPTSSSPGYTASEAQYGLLSGLVVLFSVLLSAGLITLAMLTLWTGLAGIYYLRVQSQNARHLDLTPCLQTLDELISTNAQWESIVQEVINTLEKDERTILGTSSSHTSPSSSLRVALHSTLQTTQTQCDNVRHLLSALTSPSDLSQLSEMYAPPSPLKPNFPSYEPSSRSAKSLSYPSHGARRERPTSISSPSATTTFTDHKRMTWNGPHSHFGGFTAFSSGSPASMTPIMKKALRRRSDLSSLLGTPVSTSAASFSAPVTPSPSSPLARVSEISDADTSIFDDSFIQPLDKSEAEEERGSTSFASAALKLQRNRTHNGLESFSSPHPSSPSPSPLSPLRSQPHSKSAPGPGYILPLSPRSTFLPSSRFSSIHTSRQPLSLSALRHALQAALGAKRYACAHLLALRFTDDDTSVPLSTSVLVAAATGHGAGEVEAGYWDDVKSIMELLVGALSDAGERLYEAVREVEAMKLRDQTPTPVGSIDLHAPNLSPGTELAEMSKLVAGKDGRRTRLSEMITGNGTSETVGGVVSFAPMPSQLSKFAGHVAAVQTALEDARGYLEECASALRVSDEFSSSHLPSPPLEQPQEGIPKTGDGEDGDHPALRAYEKLRRELGFALRECERGRNRLLDLVKPPQLLDLDLELEGGDSEEGVPGLGHDSQSDESDKQDAISPLNSEDGVKDGVGVVNPDEGHVGFVDDASRVLLLSADAAHLPPAHVGIEQVFEADTSTTSSATPARPRSKLSREERIKLLKARRESGLGTAVGVGLGMGLEASPVIHGVHDHDGSSGGYDEKWGPGGDVVQELKDVIWKVGERRRKVQGESQPQTQSQPVEQQASERQPVLGEQEGSESISRHSSSRSSLDIPNLPFSSKLPSPIVSPRPRRPASMRISSPLAKSPRSSVESFTSPQSPPRQSSMIPRRSSLSTMDSSASMIPRRTSVTSMGSLLEGLKREVGARGIREGEQVLSSE